MSLRLRHLCAALAVVAVAACSSADAPASVPPSTSIPHSTDPRTTLIQIGDYDFGRNVDGFVSAPQIRIYGDRRFAVYRYDGQVDSGPSFRAGTGTMTEAELQPLLRAAAELLDGRAVESTELPAADAAPLRIETPSGSVETYRPNEEPYASFIALVHRTAAEADWQAWTPERWIEKVWPAKRCTLTESTAASTLYRAPVFPLGFENEPLGEFDC